MINHVFISFSVFLCNSNMWSFIYSFALVVNILFSLWFQARVALYNNDSTAEILSLVFNATNSSKIDWFSRDRLTHSPWPDLYTGKIRGFDIQGRCCNRAFYIFRRLGGCPNDFGWLVVTFKACAWETRFPSRTVLYSNRTTSIRWSEYGTLTEGTKTCSSVLNLFLKSMF